MNALSKKQISSFVKARYPEYKRQNAADGYYCGSRSRGFISDDEILQEALAEKEAFDDGVAIKPSWLHD